MNRIISRLFLVITLSISACFFGIYGKDSYPFIGDSMGYYMYLPSTFIYHNHKALNWLPEDKHFDYTIRSYLAALTRNEPRTPKGYIISKYTYGIAVMEMPFFFVAHGYEKLTGGDASGYSGTYATMLRISSLVYALLGLIILYRILCCFFEKYLSLTATLAIFIGTNLFWFAIIQPGMAHVPVFFLYSLLMYCTILLHKRPKALYFIVAGLAAGLITIIRPTDIICVLIPLLYNVYNAASFKEKTNFLKAHLKQLLLFAVAFTLPIIPQLLYWKKLTGSFLYYSYGKESFNWAHPRILDGLFSFANGWLAYSPLMAFAILGLLCYKRMKPTIFATAILLPLYIYIAYSWYCYNYINGFGSRPMIHMYPLLAIPFTALLQYISQRRLYTKFIFSLLLLFCVSVNLSYSLQALHGILISEESHATYNLNMLFKMRADYNDMVMFDLKQKQPATDQIEKIATLARENYEDSLSEHYVTDPTKQSRYVYHMLDADDYHPKKLWVTYHKEQFKNAPWLKCSGRFLCTQGFAYDQHMFTLVILRADSIIHWHGCKIDNKIGLSEPGVPKEAFTFHHSQLNKWGDVHFFIRVPDNLADGDKFMLETWNICKHEIYFDDICMEIYRDKK